MEYRLGKKRAKLDRRTLPFKCALKGLPLIPETFDLEKDKRFPCSMMKNDVYGDCVIVGRANQTLRFELSEQGMYIHISDDEVLAQYFKEGKKFCFDSKPDRGLVMLDSLKHWRNDGWTACGYFYNIYAFAKINQFDLYEVRAAMYLLNGIYVGIALPNSARNQDIWSVVSSDNIPGSWGGHCVYVPPIWDRELIPCVTWGDIKYMTPEFFKTYTDEAYAIVDNKNRWQKDSPIDVDLLQSYLNSL